MANRIRELRKQRGITMKQLGEVVDLAESTISQYETGKRQPDNETLLKISEYFGVTVGYLLGYEAMATVGLPLNIMPMPEMRKIPLIGSIACGKPILADEHIEEYVEIPKHVTADFALSCKGDSMINARIFDGDVVYIRQQATVENGEIAAVLIDGEATLKRVKFYEDRISLEPENPTYRPIVLWGEEANTARILGKAVAFTSAVR